MRNIKFDRLANRYAERLQRLGTFQILSAVPFVERSPSDAVVFLFNQFLLQESCGFGFVFEKLPVATFTDLGPGNTPKRLAVNFCFTEFCRSFTHNRERSR